MSSYKHSRRRIPSSSAYSFCKGLFYSFEARKADLVNIYPVEFVKSYGLVDLTVKHILRRKKICLINESNKTRSSMRVVSLSVLFTSLNSL